MFEIIYISKAAKELKAKDLENIMNLSQHLNYKNSVTGCLLYTGKNFLQILEGQRSTLENLIFKIRRDRRHSELKIVSARQKEKRSFSAWGMALVNLSKENLSENRILRQNLEQIFKSEKIDYGIYNFIENIKSLIA